MDLRGRLKGLTSAYVYGSNHRVTDYGIWTISRNHTCKGPDKC